MRRKLCKINALARTHSNRPFILMDDGATGIETEGGDGASDRIRTDDIQDHNLAL